MSYPIEPIPEAPGSSPAADAPTPVPAPTTVAPGWYPEVATGRQRWWDGTKWTDYAPAPQVVVVQKKQTNHVFHLLMSIITLGLWIPVWIIVAIANA